ncbi:LacI family transcriptional regulator [Wenzhouxiangella sp. XN201]|uniref:LacI family DNA-binding transcriptional regulator n=1 Tax=Wenzhouxiangella sp. XN201 TaxID=2710755 RepID=UPI0013C81B7A|nr:LacI family DNA-binding transcriptional regulator [Wenzhouxiangella sp. XN201]NEZ04865.1 LacI family transcriptional regulator [Wenzhouxiangella sp. XN201]
MVNRRQRPNSGRVTINEVAELSGVSIKTVSRVLNNEPNVRPATRAKVEKAVEALDYSPHPSARGLAGTRSRMIGLIYDNPSPNYLFQATSGALQASEAAGYGVSLLAPEQDDPDLAGSITRFLSQSRVDGLLLIPPIGDVPEVIDALDRLDLPYARVAPLDGRPGIGVAIDDRMAAAMVVEHLTGLGHDRIGFVTGPANHGAASARLEGYRMGLARAEIDYDPELVFEGRFDLESGRRAAAYFLDMTQRPTAIFASNDEMAAGLLQVALDRGCRVPEQLSVAGYDDTPISRAVWPALTTVRQPIRPMVYRATELLLDAIVRRQSPPGQSTRGVEVFEAPLVVRATTAPPGTGA